MRRAADILGLTDYLDRYPRQLSGGQRQRVAMGRAIVRDPQVFLFDEPLSNLDAQLRVQMRTEIKALHQRLGSTSIYVTHDQIEAMTMADKIVVMRDGRSSRSARRSRSTTSRATCLSPALSARRPMNLMPGTLRASDNRPPCRDRRWRRAAAAGGISGTGGQAVYYGVRPDHLSVANCGGFDATVDVVEPTGADTLVFARAGNQKICGAFSERYNFKPGEHHARAAPGLRAPVRRAVRRQSEGPTSGSATKWRGGAMKDFTRRNR